MNFILPKQDEYGEYYLSYSQINTWKRNKRDYIRQYFLDEKFTGNSYTDFGSIIGGALELNDFSKFTKKEQALLKSIPRYDEFEKEIKLRINKFYIKGFIDTNTKDNKKIIDYKTGSLKKKIEYGSDSYIQLDIYAAALKQETGKYPERADVVLIERVGNAFKNQKLKLGNEFIIINKEINDKRIKEILYHIKEVAKEISEYYSLYLKLNKLMI